MLFLQTTPFRKIFFRVKRKCQLDLTVCGYTHSALPHGTAVLHCHWHGPLPRLVTALSAERHQFWPKRATRHSALSTKTKLSRLHFIDINYLQGLIISWTPVILDNFIAPSPVCVRLLFTSRTATLNKSRTNIVQRRDPTRSDHQSTLPTVFISKWPPNKRRWPNLWTYTN